MSEEPKRRLADRLGMSPTVISESTTVIGDVETRGPLMVSGHVQGNGRIGGTLSVGKSAHWEGDITPDRGDLGITDPRRIAPGSAARSVVVARVNRTGADAMPPLMRHAIDTAGVQLLTDWVNGLANCN